jgi:capsid protein
MQGRKKTVADQFATSIYHLILEEEINAGNVPLPPGYTVDTFYKDAVLRDALCSCEWIGASRGQIDELKETQAALLRISGGLSTREAEIAQLGRDYRKVFKQLSREKRLAKSLDLEFSVDATKPGANDAQKTMRDDPKDSEDA